MLKKLALATAAVGLLMSTAGRRLLAFVQEEATKRGARSTEDWPHRKRPGSGIGPAAAARPNPSADEQIKTVCVRE